MIPGKIVTMFKQSNTYECSICRISLWLDNVITLEIDHKDGNNSNNEISNLRYLCPNCHSQTPTWRGRNKNTGKVKVTDEELLKSIAESDNIRQALIKVGLSPRGLNYNRVSDLLNNDNKAIDFNNSQYGTVWITDDKTNKKIKKELLEEYIKCGYRKGRISLNKIKMPSIKGKMWITNGLVNRTIELNGNIPDGFWKGKIQRSKIGGQSGNQTHTLGIMSPLLYL